MVVRFSVKIESDRGAEFSNSVFQNILKAKNIQHCLGYTDQRPSIAEWVISTICISRKKPVYPKRNATWISELPSVVKQYKHTIHHFKK